MAQGKVDKIIEPHLVDGEAVDVSLRGVIAGFTIWSSLGTAGTVLTALLVPQALQLSFLPGLAVVFFTVTVGFLSIFTLVGRPMAARHDPTLSSPYVTIVLTDRRLLLIERGTGQELSRLVEEETRSRVSSASHRRGGLVRAQRLMYDLPAGERAFEFPRRERVAAFTEALG